MKTETKIIRFLIETGKEPTIKELAEGIKADYKIVHTAAMRLADKGILKKKRIEVAKGNTWSDRGCQMVDVLQSAK